MRRFPLLLVSLLIVGAGCSSPSVTTQETVQSETTVIEDGEVRAHADITADVATTVNCGDEECFEKKFAACESATLTADVGIVATTYEILGAANGGCEMSVKYPKNPNPTWVNKSMTCTFDNSAEFQVAIQKELTALVQGGGSCRGELADLMSP